MRPNLILETLQSFSFRSKELRQEADHGHHSVSLGGGCVPAEWRPLCALECKAPHLHPEQIHRTKHWIQEGRCVTSLSCSHVVQNRRLKLTYTLTNSIYMKDKQKQSTFSIQAILKNLCILKAMSFYKRFQELAS